MTQEGGYRGRKTSLANIAGRDGLGTIVTRNYYDVYNAANGYQVPSNGNRVWLFIQNVGAQRVYFKFGGPAVVTDGYMDPGGFLIINQDLPWSGIVGLYAAAVCVCNIIETSIQQ